MKWKKSIPWNKSFPWNKGFPWKKGFPGNKQIRLAAAILGLVIFALILLLIFVSGGKEKQETVRVGFVMTGSAGDLGWNGMNYEGIVEASKEMGVKLYVEENILEGTGQCLQAVERLTEEGVELIFLSSYGYAAEVSDFVKAHPEVSFYGNSPGLYEANFSSYFGRMYQMRYLAGIIAGMQTKTDQIGYVAAMPVGEVNRGISAFTMGVRSVNKNASVIVAWTNSWDDREKEMELAGRLIEEKKVDVLTYHQNQPNVIETAEAAGVYSIGYNERVEGFSDRYLTSVVWDFKQIYMSILRKYLQGNGNAVKNVWLGMKEQVIGLSEYSPLVSKDTKEAVLRAEKEILNGWEIFSGVIYDREGVLRCGPNEMISDEGLWGDFDWYVEGVEFYEDKTQFYED